MFHYKFISFTNLDVNISMARNGTLIKGLYRLMSENMVRYATSSETMIKTVLLVESIVEYTD